MSDIIAQSEGAFVRCATASTPTESAIAALHEIVLFRAARRASETQISTSLQADLRRLNAPHRRGIMDLIDSCVPPSHFCPSGACSSSALRAATNNSADQGITQQQRLK